MTTDRDLNVSGELRDVIDAPAPLLRKLDHDIRPRVRELEAGINGRDLSAAFYHQRLNELTAEVERLRQFEAAVRAALQPADPEDGPTLYQRLDSIAAAVTALDASRGGGGHDA